ncbi:MAG: very short patch repair endonuclease [Verrucomicrobia bacterium Tous-C9LFEB]|nr:MAG: very short patch repair endonuclease [Verrucomicrobia bacterium Tous-C9LFEB]
MDRLTPEKRSWLMRQVKGRDTTPELMVRRIAFNLGFRYRLNDSKLPGKPDLVFARLQKIIFVHGCFWHGHNGCRYGKLPKSKIDFWKKKITVNQKRDRKVLRQLKTMKWTTLVVWQCELKQPKKLVRKIHDFLKKSQ